jgi:hypothetical protein
LLTDPDGYRIELVQWPHGHPDGITAANLPKCQSDEDSVPDCVGAVRMTALAPNTIVGALGASDAGTIELLPRLQLTAMHFGYRLRLKDASAELRELIDFSGLNEVLRVEPVGSEGRDAP